MFAVHNLHARQVEVGSDRDIHLPEPLATFDTLAEATAWQEARLAEVGK